MVVVGDEVVGAATVVDGGVTVVDGASVDVGGVSSAARTWRIAATCEYGQPAGRSDGSGGSSSIVSRLSPD